MPATTAERLNRLFAHANTVTLAEALLELDGKENPTRDDNWARTQIIKELERRHPAAADAVGAAYDAAGDDGKVDYVRVLVDALNDHT